MRNGWIWAAALAVAAALGATGPAPAQDVTLNVVTAGDQNMVDYVTDFLAPRFEEQNPGVKIQAFGTGPGDAGSQKIWERLDAQRKAGNAQWDVDVAVIHQKMAGQMVKEDLLLAYRDQIQTGPMVTRETARKALGADVDGFVMPMFHSQTAIAYNPVLVPNPPRNYADLEAWAAQNPNMFGYNGIKGGMSGVAFVFGWIYANAPNAEQLMNGPYDPKVKESWGPALAKLKAFNQHVVLTPGNAGTLDMLNRGEIGMGPVWVDMFYTWQAEGRMSPDTRLALIEPGLPGQPMYYVIPSKATNQDAAKKFIEFATSPEIQAEGIVKRFNWYPGIDAQHVQGNLDKAVWDKLFKDIGPDDLSAKGKPMPISEYFSEIQEAFEKQVMN